MAVHLPSSDAASHRTVCPPPEPQRNAGSREGSRGMLSNPTAPMALNPQGRGLSTTLNSLGEVSRSIRRLARRANHTVSSPYQEVAAKDSHAPDCTLPAPPVLLRETDGAALPQTRTQWRCHGRPAGCGAWGKVASAFPSVMVGHGGQPSY